MKAARPTAIPSLAGRLGRSRLAIGVLALLVGAWLGWSGTSAQVALESLWSFCATP
jgi:hypothetical protein